MKKVIVRAVCVLTATCVLACGSKPLSATAPRAAEAEPGGSVSSGEVVVNGTTLHYTRAGQGPALVLLHGFPQDSSAYRKVLPALARRFSVVAPDLRGLGASKPALEGFDSSNLAEDIQQLMQHLGLQPAFVVGHDIGGIVAYALARKYPASLRGVMLLDAAVPGLEPWDELKCTPQMWHFGFFQTPTLPEQLLAGREVLFVRQFLNGGLQRHEAVSEEDVARYAAAYTGPERLHAGLGFYRAFPADEAFGAERREAIGVPMIIVGSDGGFAALLPALARALEAHGWSEVTSEVVPHSGHYVLDEQPEHVIRVIERYAG